MSIADEITREVVFKDYHINDPEQHEVSVLRNKDQKQVALVRVPWINDEQADPNVLRSLAACLNSAADEMERNP